jgi:ribosomal protein S18 acetylase RimI-like enzyme
LVDVPPFELEARQLAPQDADLLANFDSGGEWWCEEVTNHLRTYALPQQTAGYNETTLFSLPGDDRIVGFTTVSPNSLKLLQIQGAFPEFGAAPGIETIHVPVWIVVYFGVDREYQHRTIGEEMHTWLLTNMEESLGAPRFIYLQCWEENAAGVHFWTRLGYQEFNRTTPPKPGGGAQATLLWMMYDRYRIATIEAPA